MVPVKPHLACAAWVCAFLLSLRPLQPRPGLCSACANSSEETSSPRFRCWCVRAGGLARCWLLGLPYSRREPLSCPISLVKPSPHSSEDARPAHAAPPSPQFYCKWAMQVEGGPLRKEDPQEGGDGATPAPAAVRTALLPCCSASTPPTPPGSAAATRQPSSLLSGGDPWAAGVSLVGAGRCGPALSGGAGLEPAAPRAPGAVRGGALWALGRRRRARRERREVAAGRRRRRRRCSGLAPRGSSGAGRGGAARAGPAGGDPGSRSARGLGRFPSGRAAEPGLSRGPSAAATDAEAAAGGAGPGPQGRGCSRRGGACPAAP